MKYKSFYKDGNFYNQEALDCRNEIHAVLLEVFTKYSDLGFNPRELAHLVNAETHSLELLKVVEQRVKVGSGVRYHACANLPRNPSGDRKLSLMQDMRTFWKCSVCGQENLKTEEDF
jgi:hypothetical protein